MAKLEFYYPRNGQVSNSCADEWVRLSTGEKWTNASLGFLSDAWPMPVETNLREQASRDPNHDSNKAIMWYPTLLLNIDFKKALPEEGVKWLFARTESKQIKNGRFDIEVVILDDTGDIVALSHHVALAVPAERNVAKRVTGSKM
ncbi:hypothetical protein M7I_8272 [Glarea lozoyensis 74030]|nr:hypothetical protein M7I_8272 [Glarea lozoyensis 74030]